MTDSTHPRRSRPGSSTPESTGGAWSELRRSLRLLNAFRHEGADPVGFGTVMADDTVDLVSRYCDLDGRVLVDVGGGSGYVADALRAAGARAFTLEYDPVEMTQLGTREFRAGVRGDGRKLPFRDDSVDIAYSSNVLEHVAGPSLMLHEMVRIVRPGGTVYLAFTNWLSPWGGHETSPWHFLGGERAVRRYEHRYGRPPKNYFGHSLFKLHIRDVLRWARSNADVDIVDAFPRYYPSWSRVLVKVPGLREVASWNLAIVMRKKATGTHTVPAHDVAA